MKVGAVGKRCGKEAVVGRYANALGTARHKVWWQAGMCAKVCVCAVGQRGKVCSVQACKMCVCSGCVCEGKGKGRCVQGQP